MANHVKGSGQGGPAASSRALRKDAEANRARVVDAARVVLSDRGLQAPLEEIARRAGVGIGTLYRRFPDREDLVEAVFLANADTYLQAAKEGLETDDAWKGFTHYLERIFELQAADRSLGDLLTVVMSERRSLTDVRAQIVSIQSQLIERAQAAGALRADFVPEDFALLMHANEGVIRATATHAPGAWRRMLGITLDALRAERANPLPEAAAPQTYPGR